VDWSRTPLVECFQRGEAPREVRLMAARGGLPLEIPEQLAILMVLVSDQDQEIATRADRTISRLPPDGLAAFLANPEVPDEVRRFFANRPPTDAVAAADDESSEGDEPDLEDEAVETAPAADEAKVAAADVPVEHLGAARRLSRLTVSGRIKAAIQGTREERTILIRDPNRMVAAAVLSSPKLTEGDVEMIARMTSVSEEVLRQIGTNRNWVKSPLVIAALARNAKTPIGVSLTLLPRLSERDVKLLATDRNIPEPVRMTARKLSVRNTTRRQ
jgi:hypothetical protein